MTSIPIPIPTPTTSTKRLRPRQRQPHLPRGQGGARARDGRNGAFLFVETHGLTAAGGDDSGYGPGENEAFRKHCGWAILIFRTVWFKKINK